MNSLLSVVPEVRAALEAGQPVVALESTLIAHGMPYPQNLDMARRLLAAVRKEGVVPAIIAVARGRVLVGLDDADLLRIAQAGDVAKISTREIAAFLVSGKMGATTVASTMACAHLAGIRVFATGGIGGVHRDTDQTFDISADLMELARTPVLVVCAGAKSILDLPRTLELLEMLGVPVIGYGTDRFPAFYVRDSGLPVSARVNDAGGAARLFGAHAAMGGAGAVLAQPVAEDVALTADEIEAAVGRAEAEAAIRGIRGGALTPFLLSRLADLTGGRSLRANQALVVANAKLAAQVAVELSQASALTAPPGRSSGPGSG